MVLSLSLLCKTEIDPCETDTRKQRIPVVGYENSDVRVDAVLVFGVQLTQSIVADSSNLLVR